MSEENENLTPVFQAAEATSPGLAQVMRQALKAGIPLAEILRLAFGLLVPAAIEAILKLIADRKPKGDMGEPVG